MVLYVVQRSNTIHSYFRMDIINFLKLFCMLRNEQTPFVRVFIRTQSQIFTMHTVDSGVLWWACLCVCVFVCLLVCEHISRTTRPIFTNFLYILPIAAAQSSSGCVAMLCTCGFFVMDAVICAHNGQDYATQKGVYSNWLNGGQHGFNSVAYSQSDPPWAAPDGQWESDISTTALFSHVRDYSVDQT